MNDNEVDLEVAHFLGRVSSTVRSAVEIPLA